jgi:hypothetical protein
MIMVPPFEKWNEMTLEERRLFYALLKVDSKSYIIDHVHDQLKNFRYGCNSLTAFRDICDQLWSQGQDNPQVMKNILGEEAYNLLEQYQVNKNIEAPDYAWRF